MLSPLRLRKVFPGRLSRPAFEGSCEITLIRKPQKVGNVRQREIGISQVIECQ